MEGPSGVSVYGGGRGCDGFHQSLQRTRAMHAHLVAVLGRLLRVHMRAHHRYVWLHLRKWLAVVDDEHDVRSILSDVGAGVFVPKVKYERERESQQ